MPSFLDRRSLSIAALAVALAFPAVAQAADEPEEEQSHIVVTGKRVSDATVAIGTDSATATISITREALLSAPAGISGLKMLESLPGFNVQANDALGLYEFGNSVFVRAFNFQQIGFVRDGVPMGRSDQFGGSPIFRYVENENLGRVTASQGAGDVSLPSYASLGPVVQYISTGPADELGLTAQYTIGSDDFRRGFIRLDTGDIKGMSFFASYSKLDADVWRGPGTIDREHIEVGGKFDLGGGNQIRVAALYNDYFDYDSPAITKAQYNGVPGSDPLSSLGINRSGRYYAYLATVPVFPPLASAPTVQYSNSGYNQYFKQAINSRTDYLYSITGDFKPTDTFSVTITGYYEDKKGYGVSPEAYSTSLSNYNAERLIVPGLTAPKGLQYGLSTIEGTRFGVTTSASIEFGPHTLSFGAWGEQDNYHRTQARYNHAGGNPDGEPLLNEPVHLQRNYRSHRETLSLFAKAQLAFLDDRLKIEAGFKTLAIDYDINGYRNPADYINRRTPRITAGWNDWFLPQIGLVFSFTSQEQLFASYSENMALPRGADDIFSAASPIVPAPAAETSKNYEIGLRTNHGMFNASVAAFYTQFDNRLQSFASIVPGSTTTETFFQNVGGVKSYGVEFSGVVKPASFVYFNLNATYNIAKFRDNFAAFTIKDNRVPDNAKWLLQGGVTVEPVEWLVANFSARYLSGRFTNFINSESLPGYVIANAYVDIGDGFGLGPVKSAKLRFNVDNLFNKDYLGTINTTTNTLASFRPGPDRTFQLSLRGEF